MSKTPKISELFFAKRKSSADSETGTGSTVHADPFQPLADVQAPQHEEDASDESIYVEHAEYGNRYRYRRA